MAEFKSKRGFASMTPERQREIASMGGKGVPAANRSFSKSPELARAAGRKGGKNVPDAARTFSVDKTKAAAAGRLGGLRTRKTKGETQ